MAAAQAQAAAAGSYGVGTAVAAAAAVCFAIGAVLQHEAAIGDATGDGLNLRRLMSRPRWLLGQGSTVAGTALQVAALGLAPVAVVQPLLAGGLVIALAVRTVRDHCLPTAAELLGAACTAGGLAVFLIAAQPAAAEHPRSPAALAVLAAVVLAVGLVALSAAFDRGARGAVAAGIAAGIAMGIAAVLISAALTTLQRSGLGATLVSGSLWGAVVTAIAAQYASQHAFSRGSLSWSLPALTVADPLAAVPAAQLLLDERLTPGHALVWAPAALVAAIGVIVLARTGEECRRPLRLRRNPGQHRAPASLRRRGSAAVNGGPRAT